jgi:YebC/PmpR family DNA-binding regulatory protein
MSGHSKWATTKRQKSVVDVKRGKTFTKLANVIAMAARSGGPNPDSNPSLRLAIDRARSENVPRENIERAIKRGSGTLEGVTLEEFSYDAIGPAGVAIIIDGVTDNKNRTLSELRQALLHHGAKMAETGSQRWQFERKGMIVVVSTKENRESIELTAIESGAEDVRGNDTRVEILVQPGQLEQVKNALTQEKLEVAEAEVRYITKNPLPVDPKTQQAVQELTDVLLERDDVQSVVTNIA